MENISSSQTHRTKVGAAAVIPGRPNEYPLTWWTGIGPTSHWTVHTAELIAIEKATQIIEEQAGETSYGEEEQQNTFTVVHDSQSAIQAIANSRDRPGQAIVHRILDRGQALRRRGVKVRCPGVLVTVKAGDREADQLAKKVVNEVAQHDFQRPVRRIKECSTRRFRKSGNKNATIRSKASA